MVKSVRSAVLAVFVVTGLMVPFEAGAITLPDNSSAACGTAACLKVTNTSNSGTGIWGNASGTGSYGVYGEGASYGVKGYGVSGTGVWGTGSNYGIYGTSPSGDAALLDGDVWYSGDLIDYSDLRLKTDVKALTGALNKVLQLRGVTYSWKTPSKHGNDSQQQIGFIAQEVESVFPTWVDEDKNGIKGVNRDGFDALLVESVRELKNENDKLQARLDAMESRQNAKKASMLDGPLGLAGLGLVAGAMLLGRRRRSAN